MKHWTNPEKQRFDNIWRKELSKTQECYNPSCSNKAIRSHYLQKNGPLKEIAENGLIYQLEIVSKFQATNIQFKERSVYKPNEMLTFWGFCSKCDNEIFKPIEQPSVDYQNYSNLLLLSYRGMLTELNKLDYLTKIYHEIKKDEVLSPNAKKYYEDNLPNIAFRRKQLQHLKWQMEKEIFHSNQEQQFTFVIKEIEKIPVCTSALYSLEQRITANYSEFIKWNPKSDDFSYTAPHILFSIIPNGEHSLIINCYFKKRLTGDLASHMSSFKNYGEKQMMKHVRDVLSKHIETWCISPSFYKSLAAKGWDKRIIESKLNAVFGKQTHIGKLSREVINVFEALP